MGLSALFIGLVASGHVCPLYRPIVASGPICPLYTVGLVASVGLSALYIGLVASVGLSALYVGLVASVGLSAWALWNLNFSARSFCDHSRLTSPAQNSRYKITIWIQVL